MAEILVVTHEKCSIGVSVVQRRKTVKALLTCCVPECDLHLRYSFQGWSIKEHRWVINMPHPRVFGRAFQIGKMHCTCCLSTSRVLDVKAACTVAC